MVYVEHRASLPAAAAASLVFFFPSHGPAWTGQDGRGVISQSDCLSHSTARHLPVNGTNWHAAFPPPFPLPSTTRRCLRKAFPLYFGTVLAHFSRESDGVKCWPRGHLGFSTPPPSPPAWTNLPTVTFRLLLSMVDLPASTRPRTLPASTIVVEGGRLVNCIDGLGAPWDGSMIHACINTSRTLQ